MSPLEKPQGYRILSLDEALAEGCANAMDWQLESLEIRDFDRHHPELPSNAELMGKVAPRAGEIALGA